MKRIIFWAVGFIFLAVIPVMSTQYEICISGEKKDELIKILQDKFKIKLEPEYNSEITKDSRMKGVISELKSELKVELNDFYTFQIENTGKDIWQITYDILQTEKENNYNCIKSIGPEMALIEDMTPYSVFLKNKNTLSSDPTWNHELTKFDEAIKYSKDSGKFDENYIVKIAHVDTGYTNHPEIQAIDKKEGRNFFKTTSYADAFDPLDSIFGGHGTSTAGVIIGAKTSFSNALMTPIDDYKSPKDANDGVFPYVDLIPYRVNNSVVHIGPSSFPLAVFDAVDKGCKVITMSMGGLPLWDKSWKSAVDYAYKKGVIFCAAAGNMVVFVVWPARYEHIISVGAVNYKSDPWIGSCRGKEVDICAPGENVYIALTEKNDKYIYNKYGCGTSFATPHIAGAAALWLNHFRKELSDKAFQDDPSLKVDAFLYLLQMSASKSDKWDSNNFGSGILNARNLLEFNPLTLLENVKQARKKLYARKTPIGLKSIDNDLKKSVAVNEIFYNVVNSKEKDGKNFNRELAKNLTKTAKGYVDKFLIKKDLKKIDDIKKDYFDQLLGNFEKGN